MRKKLTENFIKEVEDYYKTKPMSLKEVEDYFKISHPLATKALKNIPKYPKNLIYNPELIEDYFETINTEDKAYFLGFIIGDGNVFTDYCKNGYSAMISITVDESDVIILESFKNQVKVNTTIGTDGRGARQVIVRSNKMALDLSNYGVVPRKTLKTYLPKNIPEQYMSHLIRGICDSDGSVGASLKTNSNKFNHWLAFCGTEKLMNDIADYCYFNIGLSCRPIVYTYKNRALSETKVRKIDDMYKLGFWLYDNSSFFLPRKKEKFIDFCKHYNMPTPR